MTEQRTVDARPGVLGRHISAHAARPHGLTGRALGHLWVRETATINDLAVDLLAPAPGERVLEVGCGPGRTAGQLARRGARVTCLDPSPVMVAATTRRNRAAVEAGTVRALLGEAESVPAPDASFDAVITVHTVYFWSDLHAGLRELHRVLAPGGTLVIGFRPAEKGRPRRLDPEVYRIPTTQQLLEALGDAGFVDPTVEDAGSAAVVLASVPTQSA